MFKLHSQYKPTGDQPETIKKLVEEIKKDNNIQVLLGVTGSGKTFTIANVIARVNKPTLVLAHNNTLSGQLYSEFKEFFQKTMLNILLSILVRPKIWCYLVLFSIV